jgi:hypothetical protein
MADEPPLQIKADLTEAATEATRKAGDLVDDARSGTRALLGPLSELWGWGTDAIAEHRRRSVGHMRLETDRILRERGVETPRQLPPTALPQLIEATFGDDEQLRNLWGGLAADAQDPSKPPYSPAFGKALNEFGPMETRVFLAVAEMTKKRLADGLIEYNREREALPSEMDKKKRDAEVGELWAKHITAAGDIARPDIAEQLGVAVSDVEDPLAVLQRLDVLQPGRRPLDVGWGGGTLHPNVRTHLLKLTDFGRSLYRRCTGDASELSP